MKKVFVLSTGDYSDYTIHGIVSDEEIANLWVGQQRRDENDESPCAEEHELDEEALIYQIRRKAGMGAAPAKDEGVIRHTPFNASFVVAITNWPLYSEASLGYWDMGKNPPELVITHPERIVTWDLSGRPSGGPAALRSDEEGHTLDPGDGTGGSGENLE